MLRAAPRGIERKGAGVGEAVEHAAAAGKARDREAVILLVEEEAGLLAVLHVHAVIDAVLADLRHGARGHVPALEREPALPLLHTLKRADGRVIALENAVDHNAVLSEDLDEQREKHLLDALHADGEGLRDEQVFKAVHRQAGEAVRLAEDDAAAGNVRAHDRLAVVPSVADAAAPEVRVEAVVRVAGEQADTDLALAGEKAAAKVFPFLAHRVHERAVFHALGRGDDLLRVDPRVAALDPAGPLGGDGEAGIGSFCFHGVTCLPDILGKL